MAKRRAKKSSSKPPKVPKAGLVFAGCLFLGIGFGQLAGHSSAGTLIGMGVGFLAMFYVQGK